MKYKVGDKVKIRKDLQLRQAFDNYYISEGMYDLRGKVVRIVSADEHRGTYHIDARPIFYWTDKMFECKDSGNIRIWSEDNKVIAVNEETGKRGIARCHPDDEFNFYIGAKIALARLEESETPFGWLKEGVNYYVPQLSFVELFDSYVYDADNLDKRNMERGIVFQTKEEAIKCAKKMLATIESTEG